MNNPVYRFYAGFNKSLERSVHRVFTPGYYLLQDPSIVHAGKSISMGHPGAELPPSRPRTMTVEQLEMEMRGELPGKTVPTSGAQLPIGTQPPAHSMQQQVQVGYHCWSHISVHGKRALCCFKT